MNEKGKPLRSTNSAPLTRLLTEAWRLPQNPKRLHKPTRVLSLFSGGGGLDIGFATAGFQIVASVEIESAFCKTLEANQEFFGPDHKTICADISKFTPADYKLGRIDFVIGGPPCQSFSAAGRRAGGVYGINDIRGSLLWHY